MKLLMISGDRSVLEKKRGAFWYTLQDFSKYWDRIDVICPRSRIAEGYRELEDSGVYFHPCPHGLWYQPLWIMRKGRELLSEHCHDVSTVHEFPPFYNGIGARRLSKATGLPFALEVHHIVGLPRAASVSEWVGARMSRFFLPRHASEASAVRVVNRSVKDVLTSWGVPEEKIFIVPSFYLDRAILSQETRSPETHDIVFSGRIAANKRLSTLIEAVSDLPNATLLVIGDGPERKRCEEKAKRMGISDRVTFLGWLPNAEDVIRKVKSAKLFVMNSLSEGGPRNVLEAMGSGMPVIATSVGVMPEVIEDNVNGLLTDGSREDLRNKIEMLLSDDFLRKRLGSEARKVLDRFDRALLIRKYAEFLKSLAFPSAT